jgi:tetratricopeptide (TPR) repeat protein
MLHVVEKNNALKFGYGSIMKHFFVMMAFFLILAAGMPEIINAADTTKAVLQKLKRDAVKSYHMGDVYSAISYYEAYVKLDSNDLKSMYRLAMMYYFTRNYEKAYPCFHTVINHAPKDYPMAWYYQGIVKMNLEDYALARESLASFRKIYRKKHDPHQYRRLASLYIESADWALAHPESNAFVTIQHLDSAINGSHIEFSPYPVNENKILYGALVAGTQQPDMGVRQLYVAEKESGKWIQRGPLEGPVNDPYTNTGNAVVSDDGKRMYFTRSRKNWQNKEINEIFISHNSNGSWQQPQKLSYPVNIENSTSTQPALGKNLRTGEDILYFVSDRNGTKGGMDIWYTEPDNQYSAFREPKNLGRNINSPGDECCPFYDLQTRTLYFSSAGMNGYGGYDVYQATGSAARWTDGVNLGKPLNTSYDDQFFTILKNGREGYFTSNRPGALSMNNGSCCDDIFYYYRNECTRVTSQGIVINRSNYDIYDELNSKYQLDLEYPEEGSPLPDIPVRLYAIENETGAEILITQTETDESGRYNFELEIGKQYMILIKNYGFFDKKISLSTERVDCNDTLIIRETGITISTV